MSKTEKVAEGEEHAGIRIFYSLLFWVTPTNLLLLLVLQSLYQLRKMQNVTINFRYHRTATGHHPKLQVMAFQLEICSSPFEQSFTSLSSENLPFDQMHYLPLVCVEKVQKQNEREQTNQKKSRKTNNNNNKKNRNTFDDL